MVFTWILSDIFVTDTHNGLRALSRKAYQTIQLRQRGMEHASELLDEIKKKRLRFKEVPVHIVYTTYSKQKGQDSFNFISIGFKFLIRKIAS